MRKTAHKGPSPIREYQVVIRRLSVQYRKQGRAETTAKTLEEVSDTKRQDAIQDRLRDWHFFTLSSHWKDTIREIASIGEGTSFIIDREQFAVLRDTIMLSRYFLLVAM
jgi:hypothetical protein